MDEAKRIKIRQLLGHKYNNNYEKMNLQQNDILDLDDV